MARPSKNASIDYSSTHDLTQGLLERATCPVDKPFVLVKDAEKKGLRLRVTKAGGKHWQFETRVKGKLFTRALGEWPAVSISEARVEAHRLRGMTEQSIDPRVVEKAAHVALEEERAAAAAQVEKTRKAAITVGELWPLYLENGSPKRRDAWKPRYRADLEKMAAPGGEKKKRGQGLTRPGPLYPLLGQPLALIDEDALKVWFDLEAKSSRHQAARALMMFRGFLRWCSGRPEYRSLTDRDAGRSAAILESLPANKRRTDVLETAQMRAWWVEVDQLPNRTAAIYLKALLLTGARRAEVAAMTWANVDFQWRKLTLADKIETTRTIPLTPHLAQLLSTLPRVNQFVFASTGKTGRLVDVRSSHKRVLRSVGIEHLTFHGLRRANKQRGRTVVPPGAVDQMQGHKPSGTADGYAILPLDDLRPFAERIEAHILELAGVTFDAQTESSKPTLVVE